MPKHTDFTIKTAVGGLLAAGIQLHAVATESVDEVRLELERFEHVTEIPDGGSVELRNPWGDIRVKATGGDQVRFNAVMQKIGASPHTGAFNHRLEGDRLVLTLDYPESDRPETVTAGRIDASVLVPHGIEIILHADRGRVMTKTMDGPLTVRALDSDVETKTRSRVDIQTRNGNVTVTALPSGKPHDYGSIRTSRGDIELRYSDEVSLALDMLTGSSITTNDPVLLDAARHEQRRTLMQHPGAGNAFKLDSDNGRLILVNQSRLSPP